MFGIVEKNVRQISLVFIFTFYFLTYFLSVLPKVALSF